MPLPNTPETAHRPWVRSLYLYLAALFGLVLLSIGGIRLLDLGLKAWVFTRAEQEERLSYMQPPIPVVLERVERMGQGGEPALSAEERALIRQWLQEYREWKRRADAVDPIRSRRERDASTSLAMILVGLPLYLYHWRLIRREWPRP